MIKTGFSRKQFICPNCDVQVRFDRKTCWKCGMYKTRMVDYIIISKLTKDNI